MSRHTASHLDDLTLQSLLDGELQSAGRLAAKAHLSACSRCADSLAQYEHLRTLVVSTAPEAELFTSEGEAWLRIARSIAHEPAPIREALPWLPFIPSLVFGAAGTGLELLLSGFLSLYALVGLGLLPPLNSGISRWLASLIASPALERYVFSWLGASSRAALLAPLQQWQAIPQSMQDALLVIAVIMALGALLAVVLSLYLSWTMGWSHLASADGRKGG